MKWKNLVHIPFIKWFKIYFCWIFCSKLWSNEMYHLLIIDLHYLFLARLNEKLNVSKILCGFKQCFKYIFWCFNVIFYVKWCFNKIFGAKWYFNEIFLLKRYFNEMRSLKVCLQPFSSVNLIYFLEQNEIFFSKNWDLASMKSWWAIKELVLNGTISEQTELNGTKNGMIRDWNSMRWRECRRTETRTEQISEKVESHSCPLV